jgi:hypothetical protein
MIAASILTFPNTLIFFSLRIANCDPRDDHHSQLTSH